MYRIPLFALALGVSLLLSAGHARSQSTADLHREASAKFREYDYELNRVYQLALAKLEDETSKELFREAQRAWLDFRDAESLSVSDGMRGKSAAPVLRLGTQANLTRERAQQIADRFSLSSRLEENTEMASMDGSRSRPEAAQAFYQAYLERDRGLALTVALPHVVDQLNYAPDSVPETGAELIDDEFIYYEGGSIQMMIELGTDGRYRVVGIQIRGE